MPERTDHNEAMRLADALNKWARDYATTDFTDEMATKAAALLRQQAERIAELELQPAFAQLASDLAVKLSATEAERDQLRAEVERLKPNAERYEWLRDPENVEGYSIFNRYECMLSAEALDTAIDAARTTHKETE